MRKFKAIIRFLFSDELWVVICMVLCAISFYNSETGKANLFLTFSVWFWLKSKMNDQ